MLWRLGAASQPFPKTSSSTEGHLAIDYTFPKHRTPCVSNRNRKEENNTTQTYPGSLFYVPIFHFECVPWFFFHMKAEIGDTIFVAANIFDCMITRTLYRFYFSPVSRQRRSRPGKIDNIRDGSPHRFFFGQTIMVSLRISLAGM